MGSFDTTRDDATWSAWLKEAGLDDVYYSARYARIWAREERGELVGIRHQSEAGKILYPLVLVPLDALPGGSGLLEARTPYDFGGPRVVSGDADEVQRAFQPVLVDWMRTQGVVSEFARIHPLADGGRPADAQIHAQHFLVDLSQSYDALFADQHRRHRRGVRAFSRRHEPARVLSSISEDDAAAFAELYETTMTRVGAGDDYYFSRSTLADLMSLDEMCLVRAGDAERTWGAALFLRSGSDLFYYLGASSNDRPSGTNNAIFDAAIRHGQSQGLRALHLGGGGESLREFKSQIGRSAVDYYVLRRLIDEPRYSALCKECGVADSSGFPAFRPLLVEQRRA